MSKHLRNILAAEGLIEKKATGRFNAASPFGKHLERLLAPLMGSGSRVFARTTAHEEFSGKPGLLVGVASPNGDLFPEEVPEEAANDPFQQTLALVQGALETHFGAPVEIGLTEDQAIMFLVMFPHDT